MRVRLYSFAIIVMAFLLPLASYSQISSIELTVLKSLMFKPSMDKTEEALVPLGFSYYKSGKIDQDDTQYDYYVFKRYDEEHSISEAIMIYLDTNIIRRVTPTIRYVASREITFDKLKSQCESIGASLTSEGNKNSVFYRIFQKDGWKYAFSIGKQDDGNTVYDLTINWHL